MKGGVICCGNVVFDISVWPADDFDWNTTRWVETIGEYIGGNGANTSYTLAKLGVPTRLISLVGRDARGDRLIGILRDAGVDTSTVSRSELMPTPTTVVLVHRNGDRKFLHRPGASRELPASIVDFSNTGAASWFHLANPFALPTLRGESGAILKRAKEAGLRTALDTGWDSLDRWMEDIGPCMPHTDILFVNEAELGMLGGLDAVRRAGVRDVVVKTGARGCSIYRGDGSAEDVSGFRIEPVDTTGAGDCFAGAFLAGLHRGWTYTDSARLANAVGAMVVEQLGASQGVRSWDETQAWIAARRKAQ